MESKFFRAKKIFDDVTLIAGLGSEQSYLIEGSERALLIDGLAGVGSLKYKYRNREFWCRGYYVDTAGKNAKKIQEYIHHQLDEDKAGEQITMGNF